MVNVDLFYAFLTVVNLVNCWKKTIKMNFIHVKMAIIGPLQKTKDIFLSSYYASVANIWLWAREFIPGSVSFGEHCLYENCVCGCRFSCRLP